MKRIEPEAIGDVLRQTLQQQGMTERLYETKAVSLWPSIVGADIASQTARPYVNRGIMTVHVHGAALRQELNMSRSILIRMINEAVGRETIKELFFR